MKNFRVIIVLITIGVLGVVSLIIGVRDSVIMASPVVDLTHIDEEGFRKLKKNTHVQIDVGPVWGQPIQETTTEKTYGVTTRSYESARYYEVPIFYQNSAGEICWDHSVIVRVNKDDFAMMEQQMALTEEWNNDEDATYEMLPAKVKTLEGKFVAFDKEEIGILRQYLGEGQSISDMDVKAYFTPCYMTTTNGNPLILIVFGIILMAVGAVPLIIVFAGKKSEAAYVNLGPSTVTNNTVSEPFNGGNPSAGSVSFGSSSEPDPNGELDFLKPKIGESAPAAQAADPISYNGSTATQTAAPATSSYGAASATSQASQVGAGSSYSYNVQSVDPISYNGSTAQAADPISYNGSTATQTAAQTAAPSATSYGAASSYGASSATTTSSYGASSATSSYGASSLTSQPSQAGTGSSYSYGSQSANPYSYGGSAATQTADPVSYSGQTATQEAAAAATSYGAASSYGASSATTSSYGASSVTSQAGTGSSYSYGSQSANPYSYGGQAAAQTADPVSYSGQAATQEAAPAATSYGAASSYGASSVTSQAGTGSSSYSFNSQPSQAGAGSSSYSFNSQPSQAGVGSSYSDKSSTLTQDLTNSGYSYNTQPASDSSSGVLGHPSNANAGGLFGAPTHAYDKPAVVESPDEPHIRKSQGFGFGGVGTSQPSYGGVQVAATGGGVFGNGSSETGRVQVAANGGISMSDEMMGGSTGGSTDGFN